MKTIGVVFQSCRRSIARNFLLSFTYIFAGDKKTTNPPSPLPPPPPCLEQSLEEGFNPGFPLLFHDTPAYAILLSSLFRELLGIEMTFLFSFISFPIPSLLPSPASRVVAVKSHIPSTDFVFSRIPHCISGFREYSSPSRPSLRASESIHAKAKSSYVDNKTTWSYTTVSQLFS